MQSAGHRHDEVSDLSILQLADYIAMVSLADTARYASILNVLEDPTVADSLTNWDISYLQELYGAERNRASIASERSLIEPSIRREHSRLRTGLDQVAADWTPQGVRTSTPSSVPMIASSARSRKRPCSTTPVISFRSSARRAGSWIAPQAAS